MSGSRRLAITAGVTVALGLWITLLKADEDSAPRQDVTLSRLQAQIEGLEKRIAILEAEREQATRQASAQSTPAEHFAPLLPVPRNKTQDGSILFPQRQEEPTRPAARFWLLKQTQAVTKP